jgi:hypothetical protein
MASNIHCCRHQKRGRPSKAHRDRLRVCIPDCEHEKIDTCYRSASNSEEWSWQRWKIIHGAENMVEEMTHLERIKLFGGGTDEGIVLCEPMLEVVFNLFGGFDYTDL